MFKFHSNFENVHGIPIDNRTPNGDWKRPIQLILRDVIVASHPCLALCFAWTRCTEQLNHVVGLPEFPEKSQ